MGPKKKDNKGDLPEGEDPTILLQNYNKYCR